ncbi:MAG TPA: GYF domain-containing protein, partial [Pirellulales bacterium]|nr:GYF domain-containing protein [Pirellulales bacterium]
MANRWYVKQNGQEFGPFSDAGLRRFLESDQARPGVLVRNGSAGAWRAPVQAGMAGTISAAPAAAAVSSSNTPGEKPIEVVAPIESLPPTAGPPPFWSRPATWAAAGADFLPLLSAACVGAWLLARHLNAERPTAAAPASGAVDPSVAELEQETKRLREELADLQGRMRKPEAPAPAPEAASPAFDLAAERAALAKEIAMEMARQEDLQERFNYEQGLKVDAAAGVDSRPYRSLRDERYVIHLPAVELELSKLDREGLAARRAAFEQAASDRAKRIEQMRSQIREAVAAFDVVLARQKLRQYLPLVEGDEYDRGFKLLGQLDGARLETLLKYARAMPEDARQALAEKGRAPADLMRQFSDPDLVRALQTQLPHLAALAIAEAEDKAWQQLGDEAWRYRDLTTLRRWAFLQQAFSAKLDGQLTQERVAGLVGAFGVFRLAAEPSLVGGLLTVPDEAESAFRNGVELQVALTDLYAECRKLAGDAWPPDEPPHPLAGHWAWTGAWPCHMYVNPANDEITFVQPDGETFVQ